MAVSPGQINERNIFNLFKFSPCSISDFRRFLNRLTRLEQNCLLHRNNSYIDYSYQNIYEKLGERYSPDEQCKNIFGLYSFYCGGGQNDASICLMMMCWDPGLGRCVSSVEQRAADGTPCGSKKWCVMGQCKYDSRAAYFKSDNCIYGDYKGFILDSRARYTCSNIKPHKCYEAKKRRMCCQTCDRLRIGPKGCEYGDREPEYCRTEVERQHCYDANIRSKCCKFCKQLERENAPPGCEYGDKQRFCQTIHAYNCYQSAWLCCETCQKMDLSLLGCKYGDKVSWCRYYDNKPYMCYDATVQSTCCNMCRKAATGPPGCEWGDRWPSCSLEDCKSYPRRRNCCKTCASMSISVSYKGSSCKDKASWCRTIHPSSCYRSSERRTCCSTCESHHTGPSDCPYGDRFSWCDSRKHCRRPQERADCCRSCS
ncbi:hypothetical protein LSH36_57g00047 [Paralvinella palmiformis]|uniref:ADAMTS cysteine-rich domain-containing protein n=1 Tax=Paralvinella palmiformis TaxID=53620 RepID=A0AAD9K4Z6_9ANNE|nr:hypothetical protein LSH36_57g00047 [Paralvinella palmiformis]